MKLQKAETAAKAQEVSITKAKDKELADLKSEFVRMKADFIGENDRLKLELEKTQQLVEQHKAVVEIEVETSSNAAIKVADIEVEKLLSTVIEPARDSLLTNSALHLRKQSVGDQDVVEDISHASSRHISLQKKVSPKTMRQLQFIGSHLASVLGEPAHRNSLSYTNEPYAASSDASKIILQAFVAVLPGHSLANSWHSVNTQMAHSRVDFSRPLSNDFKALEAIIGLDYLAVRRENEALAAVLAYLWITAKAAAESSEIEIGDCLLARTISSFV